MASHNLRIAIAGGGTGGHIMPVLEVIKEIRAQEPAVEFLWIGSTTGMEKDIVAKENIPFVGVPTGKWRRYFSLLNVSDLINVPIGILRASKVIRKFKPQVVFGKGGFVSVPGVVGGWMHNVPSVIHDSDFVPGVANRKLAFYATRIALTFPDVYRFFPVEKTVLTGRPINAKLFSGSAERARQFFKLDNTRPVLFVTGGSQGAQKINSMVVEALPYILEKFQVIHQCGEKNLAALQAAAEQYKDKGYHLHGFLNDEMFDAYAVADIVVSRAGSQILEIAAAGKRNLLIPLANAANNHQKANAEYFAEKGISRVLEEQNLEPHLFFDNLMELLYKYDAAEVARNARTVVIADAAERIAKTILSLKDAGSFKQ